MQRIAISLGLLVGLMGCGSVDARVDADGGTGGAGGAGDAVVVGTADAGTGGSGGTTIDGAAGSPGRPLGAGCTTDGQCGSGVCDSATSMCCSGRADSCNVCTGGYLTPKKDGTSCGGGLCDGVAPYVGERSCTATNYVCMNGVCSTTTVNCCEQNGCTTGQAACTGSAEDPSQPTVCTAGCV
jgi:hypothetical protein